MTISALKTPVSVTTVPPRTIVVAIASLLLVSAVDHSRGRYAARMKQPRNETSRVYHRPAAGSGMGDEPGSDAAARPWR
jgi:hypothetical protein